MATRKPSTPLPSCHEYGVNEAGCDEAGRGCLAGPVFAAAVILPDSFSHPWLNDSKQLSEKRRMELRDIIKNEAIAWTIEKVDADEIDRINILNASIEAMHRALKSLNVRPGAIIVDGNRFKPFEDIPYQTFVKGDGRYANIAAASILAKTERDLYMEEQHKLFPVYDWNINKGYPTQRHRDAIAEHGPSPIHRMTFRLIKTE
ncbi:MAG: ribonuclease HII [Muribaculaceae bacterium]|nr:ribonuclease HII [Muribaculaceae bacterium]